VLLFVATLLNLRQYVAVVLSDVTTGRSVLLHKILSPINARGV